MLARALRVAVLTMSALPSFALALMYYQFYWRWRDCFNSEGRCFVASEGVVYHVQAGDSLLLMFAVSLLLPLLAAWFLYWKPSGNKSR